MQIHTELQIHGYIYPDTHGNLLNAKPSATASAVAGNSSPQSRSPARLPPTAGMRPARGGTHGAPLRRPRGYRLPGQGGGSLKAGRAGGRRRSGAAPAAPDGAAQGQRGHSHPGRGTAPHGPPSSLRRPGACPPSPEPPCSQRPPQLPAPPVTRAAGARPDLPAACCGRCPRPGSPLRQPGSASGSPAAPPLWGSAPALAGEAAGQAPALTRGAGAQPCRATALSGPPAEPGGAERRILRPRRRAAAEACFPNEPLEEALGRVPSPPLFLRSLLLLFPFKKFIYLEDPPPRIDATPRRRAEETCSPSPRLAPGPAALPSGGGAAPRPGANGGAGGAAPSRGKGPPLSGRRVHEAFTSEGIVPRRGESRASQPPRSGQALRVPVADACRAEQRGGSRRRGRGAGSAPGERAW